VRAPPERDVTEPGDAQRESHVPAHRRPGTTLAPARPPRRGQAAEESGQGRDQGEGQDQVDGEDEQIARLAPQAGVESGGGEGEGGAEEETAEHAHARGRPRGGARGAGRARAREHETVDAVLEIAEPPQLVADLVDGRERPFGHGSVWTGTSGRLGLT
jgi:hypothetical protein